MKLHEFAQAPPPAMAAALARFEEQFRYPLGPGRTFRIAHGDDYARFFRAIGEAACFVVEREGRILGVACAALRRLRHPDGEERAAVYLGDLKVEPAARGGRVLLALACAVRDWASARAQAAFAVVMEGGGATPPDYTGRLGIPAFTELGRTSVLRLAVPAGATSGVQHDWRGDAAEGSLCFARLSAGRFACCGGTPALRSEMAPEWLVHPGGAACGRLEDTLRAKRLIGDDGVELKSAHLSCFAFGDVAAGAELLVRALLRAGELGLPALFVAVPRGAEAALRSALPGVDVVTAPARIYGSWLESGARSATTGFDWNINTAEV